MLITPAFVLALAMLAYASTRILGPLKPAWSRRLGSWQAVIGVVATVAAILIVMNPEFYALGILGDSAFVDLLALAIGLQVRGLWERAEGAVLALPSIVRRFIVRRFYETCLFAVLLGIAVVSPIQKLLNRITS